VVDARRSDPPENVTTEEEVVLAAYIFSDIGVTDQLTFEEYRRLAPATVARYGGRYLTRGGRFEKLEGDWEPSRLTLVSFSSFEQAKDWYQSPDYQTITPLRFQSARTRMFLIDDH